MSIQSINGVLDQINFQVQQVATSQRTPFTSGNAGAERKQQFSDILFNSLNTISTMQTQAKNQAQDYMMGSTKVGLNDVMIDMQKSSLAINFGVQARNKLVNAYQEIMSMPV
ncbi:flagellar hook-basal body complex protein FliE [Scandinavium sp.]|uniref:flagellar hook-basal body complex protein FliE n=1 Tax=Scandinavium sp. TaxID=2830653 RepID=UPI00289FE743|nr:flagellar hook-basal body complex protein FliE [Scandinavium sp.]